MEFQNGSRAVERTLCLNFAANASNTYDAATCNLAWLTQAILHLQILASFDFNRS